MNKSYFIGFIAVEAFLVVVALGQLPQATQDQIHVNYAFKGDSAFTTNKNILLDSPLFLSKDSTGQVHMGAGSRVQGMPANSSDGITITPVQLYLDNTYSPLTPEECASERIPRLTIDPSGALNICSIKANGDFYLIKFQGSLVPTEGSTAVKP